MVYQFPHHDLYNEPDLHHATEKKFEPYGLIVFFYGDKENDKYLCSLLDDTMVRDITASLQDFTKDDAKMIYTCKDPHQIYRVIKKILHRIQKQKGHPHYTRKIQEAVVGKVAQQFCVLTTPSNK